MFGVDNPKHPLRGYEEGLKGKQWVPLGCSNMSGMFAGELSNAMFRVHGVVGRRVGVL